MKDTETEHFYILRYERSDMSQLNGCIPEILELWEAEIAELQI